MASVAFVLTAVLGLLLNSKSFSSISSHGILGDFPSPANPAERSRNVSRDDDRSGRVVVVAF